MRLAFAGTPEFAVSALNALHAAGHDIAAVFTQPDRPSGRGQKLTASAVAQRASTLNLPLFKPEKFRDEAQQQLRALKVDLMVVAAYGLILPQTALDIPARGCLNIHASLLPRWRGAAPIQRAILAGDTETGVTLMRMEAGLDTGPMLLRGSLPITAEITAGELHDQLAALGAQLIVQQLAQTQWPQTPQPAQGVTYAPKLSKEEARVDWSRSAAEVVRAIHAYNPWPGAWSELGGERLKLLRAQERPESAEPGRVISVGEQGLHIGAGQGSVLVTELLRPGGRISPPGLICQNWNPAGLRLI